MKENKTSSIFLYHDDKKYKDFVDLIHSDKYVMDLALSYNRDYGIDDALKLMDYETVSSFLFTAEQIAIEQNKEDKEKVEQIKKRYKYLVDMLSNLNDKYLETIRRIIGHPYPDEIIEKVHNWFKEEIKAGEEDFSCYYYGSNEVLDKIDSYLGCSTLYNDYVSFENNFMKAKYLYSMLLKKRKKESTTVQDNDCVLKSQANLPEPDQKTKEAFKTYEDIITSILAYGQKVYNPQPSND